MTGLQFVGGLIVLAITVVIFGNVLWWLFQTNDAVWVIRAKVRYWGRLFSWWLHCRWLDLLEATAVQYVDAEDAEVRAVVQKLLDRDRAEFAEADTQPLPVLAEVLPTKGPYLYTDDRKRRVGFSLTGGHGAVVGRSGSGKGNIIQLLCLCVLELGADAAVLSVFDRKAGLDYAAFMGQPGFQLFRGRGVGRKDQILAGLKELEKDMEQRLEMLFQSKKRNIGEYNKTAKVKLPYRVMVCDELADFTDAQKSHIETMIALFRACGLVVIVATQHPLAEHMSSTIQANVSWRFVCRVANRRQNLVATGSASNAEVEIDPTGLVPGQAILRDEDGWRLVDVPLLTEEWRDEILATKELPNAEAHLSDGR